MKKELLVTQSADRFSKACSALKEKNINYKSRLSDQSGAESSLFSVFFGSSRRARGSVNQNASISNIYYIFVDSKDFEEAQLTIVNCI